MARGRYFQIAIAEEAAYITIAQCTSQKLTVSAQTSDVTTKDLGKVKEITGRSWTLSSDNLVCNYKNTTATGKHAADLLKFYLQTGDTLNIRVQYVAPAVNNGDAADENEGNNTSPVTILAGTVRITKFDLNFPNKENSSYTVEFAGVGAPEVA